MNPIDPSSIYQTIIPDINPNSLAEYFRGLNATPGQIQYNEMVVGGALAAVGGAFCYLRNRQIKEATHLVVFYNALRLGFPKPHFEGSLIAQARQIRHWMKNEGKAAIEGCTNLVLPLSGISVLPPEIALFRNLQHLDLSDNLLTFLPPEIGELTSLETLLLPCNMLTTLPPEMGRLDQLKRLDVYSNKLTTLPSEIGRLTALEELNLRRNLLISLPPEIGELTSLKFLRLQSNKLTTLPTEIGRLDRLETLWMTGNKLTVLPSEIGNLTALEDLNLTSNALISLPPELGQCEHLQNLILGDNLLTDLPYELHNLSLLSWLDLSSNLFAELPIVLRPLLRSLTTLEIGSNYLTAIPDSMMQIESHLNTRHQLVLDRHVVPPEHRHVIPPEQEIGIMGTRNHTVPIIADNEDVSEFDRWDSPTRTKSPEELHRLQIHAIMTAGRKQRAQRIEDEPNPKPTSPSRCQLLRQEAATLYQERIPILCNVILTTLGYGLGSWLRTT